MAAQNSCLSFKALTIWKGRTTSSNILQNCTFEKMFLACVCGGSPMCAHQEPEVADTWFLLSCSTLDSEIEPFTELVLATLGTWRVPRISTVPPIHPWGPRHKAPSYGAKYQVFRLTQQVLQQMSHWPRPYILEITPSGRAQSQIARGPRKQNSYPM